jgi:hypothetical protein
MIFQLTPLFSVSLFWLPFLRGWLPRRKIVVVDKLSEFDKGKLLAHCIDMGMSINQ